MLAELAIANAAFAVIKTTVQNSGDILDAAGALTQYFNSKSSLQKKVNEKGGDKSDLEEWMALQKFEAYETELKELLIYYGKPGQWDSWLQFQAEAKRKREADAKAEILTNIKRREAIWGWINGVLITVCVATGLFAVALLVWFIVKRGI
jgi:hypothetical protein